MVLLPCLSFVLMLCVPVTDITFTDARDHSLASKDTILVIGYDVIVTISPSFARTRVARCMGAPGDMLGLLSASSALATTDDDSLHASERVA